MNSREQSSPEDYWNSNLDPDNIGRASRGGPLDFERELPYYLIPDQIDALNDFAPLERKRILDIGAGIGMNALYLGNSGAIVVAADIARNRLAALAGIASGMSAPPLILPVQCRAEALPFASGSFDHAYSKSVLIHTRLAEACGETNRVLREEGSAVFIEPLAGNPFANLYRALLAPKIWRSITRYFGQPEFDVIAGQFCAARVHYYYFLGFLAFFWQFGLRAAWLFKWSLNLLVMADGLLFRICQPLERRAWFAVIHVRKRPSGESALPRS
ncbi:MAG: class I SAM-dependent methyltransferase [bacterium]|nr:class I SAM-dependent methyltransferase [Candidatus Sumerlaeota bacterium]